ncbi:Bifunctional transcriptional activator/DNA repair enzyme AdaA [compost metagenome]
MQVVSFLYQKLKGNHHECIIPNGRRIPPLADTSMTKVLDYIHEHYKEQLNMDSLSAIALQSKYHFIRSFAAAVGVTPYQYILQLRIHEAKIRLAGTSDNITHISYSLGFSTPSQFFRVFAKVTGTTPESYRKTVL